MAPKTRPSRRTPKTTARKSVLSKCTTSNLKTSSSGCPEIRPPSSAAGSSPEFPSNDTAGLFTSPHDKYNAEIVNSSLLESSYAIISDHEPPQGNSSVAAPGREITLGDKVQEGDIVNSSVSSMKRNPSDSSVAGISSSKAKDGILVRPKSGVFEGAPSEIEGSTDSGTSFEGGTDVTADTGPEVKGNPRDGVLAEVDKAASRTRKLVKKVRIVKKIIKRRVPKRVVKGSVGNEEVERLKSVDNPIEGNESNLEHGKNGVHSMEAERVDPNGSVRLENPKPDQTVALEVANEDSKEIKVEATECRELGVSMRGSSSQVLVSEEDDGKESEEIEDQLGNQNVQFVETKSGDLVEYQNAGPVKEREGGELVNEVVENHDVELSGGVALGEEMEALEGQGEEEAVTKVDENNDFKFNGGVALSGKMEALEEEEEEVEKVLDEKNDIGLNGEVALSGEMGALVRKKRRRTEIFLGGLDKDTTEEDIRNVFEQVGKVTEVRLVMNSKTGKNRGFAFLRFASADEAKIALEKYSTVKICGKQCGAQPADGNDTIFLGNINRKWKSEDVVKLLKDARIEKIDKVTVNANPSNFEQNRGFAFLEFETCKDAQIAFSKLQKNDFFVNQMKIKVAWAQPLIEPNEEEMLKVKSVYAEYLPPSWDEEKIREFFGRFGEVESVALSKNLPSSKRTDFAFVNYTKREAALACIQAFGHEQLDNEGSKLKVKVSLAKPSQKAKQMKHVSTATGKELEQEKRKASQSTMTFHEPRKKGRPGSSNLDDVRVDRAASTTDELLQLLRQQALEGQTRTGSSTLNYHYSSAGSRRSFSALGTLPLPSVPRGFPPTRLETPHLSGNPSASSHRVGMVSLPYSQQPQTSYTLESSYGFENDPYVMARERANYRGHSGIFRRY